ncbi:MAG: hypothetical protein P8Y70_03535 [Candidatus Lokiarchaeota archaeon]
MVYFELSRLGFNCGLDKDECKRYPDECIECIKTKLSNLGFEFHSNFKINEMDSDETRLQMYREIIWQKFWDVLNIKHIVLMSKNSGLNLLDYPITGSGIDVNLLSGFIQANITFSESGNSVKHSSSHTVEESFYEFDYKDFNILLKEGDFIRICLVLENKASESLKEAVKNFIQEYEAMFHEKLINNKRTGSLDFSDTLDFIIAAFDVELVFPMVLTHTIPPRSTEIINANYIMKAILKIAREMLIDKPFFFINNVLNQVREIVNIDSAAVLYEIYQLLEMEIILPTKLEVAENKFKRFKEHRAMNLAQNEILTSKLSNDTEFSTLKQELEKMNEKEARELMIKYVKKGETAENALIFEAALKEYEKALYLATGFNFEKDIGRISFLILELEKKINEMEFDYAQDAAEKAEKQKDYINSISYYRKAVDILENTLDSVNVNTSDAESKIKKIKKKIAKLEAKV